MAMSDNLVRNKMLEVERERLEVEKNTTKVLEDIRDILLADAVIKLAEMADNSATTQKNLDVAKDALNDAGKGIKKRWSE